MKEIEGLSESFKASKVLFMVTFGSKGEKHSRPMVNVNTNPNVRMWFSTYRDCRKVRDIQNNPRVRIFFHKLSDRDRYFEINGHAEFGSEEEVEEKWFFWYLILHPEMRDYFWFPPDENLEERVIINVYPDTVRIINKEELKEVHEPYDSYELK
jgi:general stress protein 26